MFLHPFLAKHRCGPKKDTVISDKSIESFTRSLLFRRAGKSALSLNYRLEIVDLGLLLSNGRHSVETNHDERQKQNSHFEALDLSRLFLNRLPFLLAPWL